MQKSPTINVRLCSQKASVACKERNKLSYMSDIGIIILAYFLIDTLNWHVLLCKEKYLLDNLYEK